MDSPNRLSNDDRCRRLAYLADRWEPPCLSPGAILRLSLDHGLMSDAKDPGEDAAAYALDLAVTKNIDTAEVDILGVAEHLAGLVNFLVWLLRAENPPYKRPAPVRLPQGSLWTSGAFLNGSERGLRRVELVDRWDSYREVELRNSWRIMGECSAYQVPMDVIVVEIGSLRNGRWTSPFTAGWRHPVAKTLRFQKRDGESFAGAWERVWRERDNASRTQWLDAMSDDGVLADSMHVLSVETPPMAAKNIFIAESKLARIQTEGIPEPQLSVCFDRVRLCPFRSACPQGIEPSAELGFTLLL